MIGLAVIVGETISLGALPPVDKAILGFLTAALMMAGTMVLNDIYDIDVDRLNSPERPLPSGKVAVGSAYYYAAGLSLSSLAFAFGLGLRSLLVALLALTVMLYYNTRGKKSGLFGNGLVSFNVALPFVFGGISVSTLRPIVLVFSVLAFLSNFGREVAKGISDVQGDKSHGVRTLAVLKGPRIAAIASASLLTSAVIASLVPVALRIASAWYLPVVLVSDAGFLASSVWLVKHHSLEVARKIKSYLLLWMLLGLVAFLVGGLT